MVDNGSSNRGQKAIDRLKAQFPNAVMVHTPVHASWLNQVDLLVHRPTKLHSLNAYTDTDTDTDHPTSGRFGTRYNQPPKHLDGSSPPTTSATSCNVLTATPTTQPPPDHRRTCEPTTLREDRHPHARAV